MSSWDDLSLSERSEMMRIAVQNGITNLKDIRQKYNEFAEGGDTAESDEWKALNKINYESIPDTAFTRDKTGAGSIEYFAAEDSSGITYPNGYHRNHPKPGRDVILYNPKDNDYQDIRLDALHIMPKDATYDALNTLYRNAAKDSDVAYIARQRYNDDVKKYGINNVDSYEQYFNNEADGLLRNMFIEGTPKYIESKRYYPDKKQLREWNKPLLPYIDNIQKYLETGKRPPYILPEITVTGKKKALGGNIYDGKTESTQQIVNAYNNYVNPQSTEEAIAKLALQLADPTGISSWPDVKEASKKLQEDVSWENAKDLAVEILGALPLLGKVTAPFKAAKTAKILAKLGDATQLEKAIETTAGFNRQIDTLPEFIPGIRKLAEKTQDLTTKWLVDPLFYRNAPANKLDKVSRYRKANTVVDAVNISNSLTDLQQGVSGVLDSQGFNYLTPFLRAKGGNLYGGGGDTDPEEQTYNAGTLPTVTVSRPYPKRTIVDPTKPVEGVEEAPLPTPPYNPTSTEGMSNPATQDTPQSPVPNMPNPPAVPTVPRVTSPTVPVSEQPVPDVPANPVPTIPVTTETEVPVPTPPQPAPNIPQPTFVEGAPANSDYHRYWLEGRQEQLQENYNSASDRSKSLYNATDARGIMEEQLNTIEKYPERFADKDSEEDSHMYSYTDNGPYTTRFLAKVNTKGSEKDGRYTRVPKDIVYAPEYATDGQPSKGIIVHERTHAMTPNPFRLSPQEEKVQTILTERYGDRVHPYGSYFFRPDEVNAGLYQNRYELGLTPDYIVTPEDVVKWRNEGKLNRYLLDKDDDIIVRLFNEVAYAPTETNENERISAFGGPLVRDANRKFK